MNWVCTGSWGVWGPLWMGFWFGIAAANFVNLAITAIKLCLRR